MNVSERGTGGRSKGWYIAAIFVAGIVIVAAIVFAVRAGDSGDGPAAGSSTSSVAPSDDGFRTPVTDVLGRRVDVPVAESGHPLAQTTAQIAESDPSWLSAPPVGTTSRGGWQRVHGVSVPFSTSDGPTRISNAMAAGYAHTPRGAALAAVYLAHQLAARPADPAVVARVNYSPQDMDRYRERVSAGTLPAQQPEHVTRWIVAPDAYQIVTWAPDLVVLKVATRGKPGTAQQAPTWTAIRYTVVWTGGDWNLLPNDDVNGSQEIASILGWTPW